MLERAALHQTRFRTPGVAPDARGVVLGQKGVVLFPSLDRLVAFLRAYGEEGSLDELLPSLSLRRVVTPLKTREILLTVSAESSYRMDRIASVAKLAGGLVFTGTSRHFVKYRDAGSPLGYDIEELLDERADAVLYHDSFRQVYSFERELAFRELVMKLEPLREPPSERSGPSGRLFATAEVGIGGALVGYLFRWQVRARAAMAEWPSQSAFDDNNRRLYLFEVTDAPARIVELMTSLPGVHVFEPLGTSFAVERGFRHPIALESCQSIFDDEALTLFQGGGEVLVVDPAPPFAAVRSLVRNDIHLEEAGPSTTGAGRDDDLRFDLPLRLDATMAPWRNVVAAVVPAEQRAWLARMLYALPPRTLSTLRMAMGERIYLLDPGGIEGVPLGVFYSEVASRIYVPAGMTLVPAVAPAVLESLVSDRQGGHVFFEPDGDGTPRVVPQSAFGPVSRQVLREVEAMVVHADAPDRVDPPLPLMQYGDVRRFPLWGVAGKKIDITPPPEGDE